MTIFKPILSQNLSPEISTAIIKTVFGRRLATSILPIFVLPLATAFILLLLHLNYTKPSILISIAVVFVFAYMARLLLVTHYHTSNSGRYPHDQWLNRYRIATALCGLVWGVSGWLLFSPSIVDVQTSTLVVAAGISAGSVIKYAIDRITLSAFMIPMLVILTPKYLMAGGFVTYMAYLLMLFIIFLLISTRKLTEVIHENIQLVALSNKNSEVMSAYVQRQKLHTNLTPMGVIEWDTDFKVTAWNPAAERIFGYTLQEALGQHAQFIVPAESQLLVTEIMTDLITHVDTHHSGQSRNQNIKKNGEVIDCEWFNTPLIAHDGKAIGIASLVQDITDFNRAQNKVKYLAYYDVLTDLPNRALLIDRLRQALVASSKTLSFGSVMFIDLDGFKELNDTKGHAIGDLLLKEAAARFQVALRKSDIVARIGGDEFIVLLENLEEDESQATTSASILAGKIIETLRRPFNFQGYEHECSASIGVTMFCGDSLTVDQVIKHADNAMYEAKRTGRNGWKFYNKDVQPQLD